MSSAPVLPPPNIYKQLPQNTQQSQQPSLSTPISQLSQPSSASGVLNAEINPTPQGTIASRVSPLQGNGGGDPFWGDDWSILLEKSRLREFFPTTDQTLPERMNSVSRLVIYISVALSVYQGKATAFHFGMMLMGILYFIWKSQTVAQLQESMGNIGGILENAAMGREGFASQNCTMPTVQNPYMNWLIGDSPLKAPACQGPGIQEQASALLNDQLFSDVDDLFSKNANQRLFRTMPNTGAVSDNEKFANWLIKGEKGCKTDGFCPPYEDLRSQRQLIPEDLDKDFAVTGFTL